MEGVAWNLERQQGEGNSIITKEDVDMSLSYRLRLADESGK